jgi:undecaprenyl-phosphate 4-deoxy-4-formamido-L-arabinose transferase
MKLSIVIPVYRSQNILPQLVEEVQKAMESIGLSGQFELILINDASPDGSWQVICGLAERYGFICGVSLRKNFGQHSAIMAGLHQVRGEVIVTMDDDLQHPPGSIKDLLHEIEAGADVCYTCYQGRQHAAWKILGSRFNNWVAGLLLDKPDGLYLSSFKAMRREVVREVIKYNGPYAYLDGLILDVTSSIRVIDIAHQPRREGEGNYNLKRSVSLWLRMATSSSLFPLRVAIMLGFSLTILSFVIGGALLIYKLLHPEVPIGWTSLVVTILFIGGVQTFCIGMLGEYLGRAYLKINGKPQFVIGATTWKDEVRP